MNAVLKPIQITDLTTGEVKNYSEAEYIAERDRRLQVWSTLKIDLDSVKEKEMQARKEAVSFSFNTEQTGTQNIELGGGWKAKAVIKTNYGFVKSEDGKLNKQAIDNALSRIEALGEAGTLIADRLVKWTPELSLTEYKQLPGDIKNIIDGVIVTSEASPTLELVPPKAKK